MRAHRTRRLPTRAAPKVPLLTGTSIGAPRQRISPEETVVLGQGEPRHEARPLPVATTHISLPVIDETWRHTLTPQTLVPVAALIQRLPQVTAKGLLLGVPVEVAVAVARTAAESRARKGSAHEATLRTIQVPRGRSEPLPIRKGATHRALTAAILPVASTGIAGIRSGRPLGGGVPGPDLAPLLGAREAEEALVLQLGPLAATSEAPAP